MPELSDDLGAVCAVLRDMRGPAGCWHGCGDDMDARRERLRQMWHHVLTGHVSHLSDEHGALMPNATLRQRITALARQLFGYAEPCPECGAETRYENVGEDRDVWLLCTKCEWGQRRA